MDAPKSPWGGLARLTRLPWRQWLLAVEAGLELALMKAVVLSVSPRRYGYLLAGEEHWPMDRLPKEQVKLLIWAIEAVGQYAPGPINCLPRALALQRMLRRRGAQASIRFGVKKQDSQVRAHAWVVLDGKILIGNLPDLLEFTPLSQWPSHLQRKARR